MFCEWIGNSFVKSAKANTGKPTNIKLSDNIKIRKSLDKIDE